LDINQNEIIGGIQFD